MATTKRTGFSPPRTTRGAAAAVILAAGLLAPAPASADPFGPGFALFETKVGITNGVFLPSFVDLGFFVNPMESVMPVVGKPLVQHDFGPGLGVLPTGNTDIVVKFGGIDPDPFLPPSGEATVPVEIVALSLQSAGPTGIYTANGTQFFDVFITLDPALRSLGQMTVRHERADGGTYFGEVALNAIKEFIPIAANGQTNGQTNGLPDTYVINIIATYSGTWSHEPEESYPTIPNNEWFPEGTALWAAAGANCPQGPGLPPGQPPRTTCFQTAVSPAQIPEPATLALFAFGLAGLGLTRRRRTI